MMRWTSSNFSFRTCAAAAVGLILGACAQLPPTSSAKPETPVPSEQRKPDALPAPAPPVAAPAPETPTGWQQRGEISLYGNDFAGKPTASGAPFDPQGMTMAHRTLPFGTVVRVTNLENRRSVDVVVNDRGPFVPGRIADLSAAAAERIGMVSDGVVDAVLEILQASKPR